MPYVINYQKICEHPECHPIVKSLAHTMVKNPYMLVKDFFTALSDDEVQSLMELVEDRKDSWCLSNLILISEMLARAEGLEPEDDQESSKNVSSLIVWITCVSLERKGLVRVFYENMSFGQEFDHKKLVENIFQ